MRIDCAAMASLNNFVYLSIMPPGIIANIAIEFDILASERKAKDADKSKEKKKGSLFPKKNINRRDNNFFLFLVFLGHRDNYKSIEFSMLFDYTD